MTDPATATDHPAPFTGNVARVAALESEAAGLESITLSPAQLADLALILYGAYEPLRGYMDQADYTAVLDQLRLADGRPFPLPVALDADTTTAHAMKPGMRVALRDVEGVAMSVLSVGDVWRRDARREAQALGVDEQVYGQGSCYLGGSVEGIRLPAHPFFARLRPSPAALRERIRARGFNRVLAVESAGVIGRAEHAIITRAAGELDAAILLHPAIGSPDPGDTDQVLMIKCQVAALAHFPRTTTMLALLDYPARGAGVREILLHALLRKHCGATHFMMRGATQRVVDSDPRLVPCLEAIGVDLVPWPEHGAGGRDQAVEGSEAGSFAEVTAVLESHRRPPKRGGFTLFFTGLSGSGKSTIAKIVQARVAERDPRRVTLLDGDIVRRQFSKGLGFSRQDRDTNVRRIGAAAADITKGGGVAICCPIAPYAETRRAVRGMIEPHGPMIEIHVATPLEVCERRDPKGLYKKARQGRIQNFTGVDDPYEAPQSPDIRIDTSESSAEDAAESVIDHLQSRGLLAPQSA